MSGYRIQSLVRSFLRTVLLPLVGLLVGLAAAAGTTTVLPTTYEAGASVIVGSTTPGSSAVARLSDVSLAQNLTSSVAQLAQSREVAVAVAAALGVPESEVTGHITGIAQLGIQIVKVQVKASTGARAAAMANAAIIAVAKVSNALHLGGSAVSVSPLDQAGVPRHATSPRVEFVYALGGLIGLVIGGGLLSLRRRLDDRLRRVGDIEAELALPVVGVIGRRAPARDGRGARTLYARNDVGVAVDSLVSSLSVLIGQQPGRRILVAGVREEHGAAFVAALLAVGSERPQHHTTLLEVTLRMPTILRYFPEQPAETVTDILGAQEPADPETEFESEFEPLSVITHSALSGYFDQEPTFEQVGALIDALASNGDDVIVVSPAVLSGRGLSELARHADAVLLTIDSDRAAKTEAGRAALLVQRLGVRTTGVVVTGASAEEDGWQPMSWPAIDGDTARGSVALPDRSLLPRTTTAPSRTQQGAL